MNVALIKPKLPVLTQPEDKFLILAEPEVLAQRKATHGTVWKPVQGYQGAWWVKHAEDGTVAPYWYHELQEDPNPPEEPRLTL